MNKSSYVTVPNWVKRVTGSLIVCLGISFLSIQAETPMQDRAVRNLLASIQEKALEYFNFDGDAILTEDGKAIDGVDAIDQGALLRMKQRLTPYVNSEFSVEGCDDALHVELEKLDFVLRCFSRDPAVINDIKFNDSNVVGDSAGATQSDDANCRQILTDMLAVFKDSPTLKPKELSNQFVALVKDFKNRGYNQYTEENWNGFAYWLQENCLQNASMQKDRNTLVTQMRAWNIVRKQGDLTNVFGQLYKGFGKVIKFD